LDAVTTAWALPLFWAQTAATSEEAISPWKWLAWIVIGFFGAFPGIVAYLVWAERKIAARFQDRIGPNRVGPLGLLQPVADLIKLITKEDLVPREADQWVHLLAPLMLLVSSFLVLAVIPFGYGLEPINLNAGLLYLVAVSSLSALGVFLAGWSSRNKYSLLGGMRSVAQLISYEVPQVLATIPIILWTGSLSLITIVEAQTDAPGANWFIFSPPGLLAFAILTIANIAEVNRAPFDLPEAESEIIAGYHTEYSGMRFGLFFLAEYMSVFGVSCLGTVLFLGGASLPYPLNNFPGMLLGETLVSKLLTNGIAVIIFFTKVLLYVFLMFWVRATLPRIRVDRLMNFAWKYLVPLSVINILAAAVWFECVIRPGPDNAGVLKGWLLTGAIVVFSVWGIVRINRVPKPARPQVDSLPATTISTTAAAMR
jgi:NADH-quinone oxidoreductase subunit H